MKERCGSVIRDATAFTHVTEATHTYFLIFKAFVKISCHMKLFFFLIEFLNLDTPSLYYFIYILFSPIFNAFNASTFDNMEKLFSNIPTSICLRAKKIFTEYSHISFAKISKIKF